MKILPTLSLLAILAAVQGCCTQYVGSGPKHRHRHENVTPLAPPPAPAQSARVTAPAISLPERSDVAPVAPVATTTTTTTTVPTSGADTLYELRTEDLAVSKATVSNGAVRVRKYVVSETKSVPVTVCRDEIVVERLPASGSASSAPWVPGETVIDLPLTRETASPVVSSRIYEILRLRKTQVCDTATVSATTRTEKADVTR